MANKRIIFAGTPDFAVPSLETLLAGPEEVVAVLTQPDRPAGRGRVLTPSPVKQLALAHGVSVLQPESLRGAGIQDTLRALAPDLMVVVAYGLLLPQAVLDIPRLGAINVHASLLPFYRGAAPIARAIAAGETVTGVSIMQMEAGLDSGPVLWTLRTPIGPRETAGELHDRLKVLGARALREAADHLWEGTLQPVPQDHEKATYAPKLRKEEAELDWRLPAEELDRLVRAYNPYPVAYTKYQGKVLRVWEAEARRGPGGGLPGEILGTEGGALLVAAGRSTLALTRVQMPGKAVMAASDFINGYQPRKGDTLGA